MFGKSMAHIEKVVSVYPIEGADSLEMAQVLDYHVAVKKGEFKVDDLALYIEIDSIVPDGLPEEYQLQMNDLRKAFWNASKDDKIVIKKQMEELATYNTIPVFEFLRSRGFKIRQVFFGKLNVYSQGILFTLDKFPQITTKKVGFDATDLIGIKQIIEDEDEAGVTNPTVFNNFLEKNPIGKLIDKKFMRYSLYRDFKKSIRQPKGIWHNYFPSKSDEENIQKLFTKMKTKYGDQKWYVTEKLEGQNISVVSRKSKILGFFNKHEFGVCTHHRFLPKYDGSNFWRTVIKIGLEAKIKEIPGNWFIRGEHTGTLIQGNIYNFPETDIYVFDVYDIDNKRMLPFEEMIAFCKKYDIKTVPILDTDFTLPETVGEMLDYSNGYSVFGNKINREGVIVRLLSDPTVSFKAKSPIYLDKQGKKKEKE